MGDFDETKHLRDSNGRFTSGAAGFVAKHTGKLEGYGGKGEPGAGRYEHDPNKETSPLAKWVASKHGVDLDLMRASKSASNPSTGDLDASNSFRGTDFIEKEMGRLTMQKEALVKESRKAEVSRVGYQNKVASAKYALEDVTPAYGDEEKDRQRRVEAKKVLDKGAERKEKEAATRRDDAHKKLGDVMAQFRSANDALRVMQNVQEQLRTGHRHVDAPEATKENLGFVKDDKKDYTFNVSHDRQGNWEINVRGDTRTTGHPGEKSMVYRVAIGASPMVSRIDKKKNIIFDVQGRERAGVNALSQKSSAPTHTMDLMFPPHKDTGASHPLEGEQRYKPATPGRMGANANDHNPSPSDFFHEVDTSKP